MWSASFQMLLITLLVISFNEIGRCAAADGPLLVDSNGVFNESLIEASGITDTNDLKRLQYDCCKGAMGNEGGLCLSTTGKPTIEIRLTHLTKVGSIKIQTPDNYSIGYLKSFKLMYKEKMTDKTLKHFPDATTPLNVFANSPKFGKKWDSVELAEKPLMEKLIIQIETYENQPCLRMEVFGCLEKDCPVMWETPEVDAEDTGENKNEVEFRCSVTEPDRRDGVFHGVTWILNGEEIVKTDPSKAGSRIVGRLHQKDLYKHLPESNSTDPSYKGGLKCAVHACSSQDCGAWTSPSKHSKELLPTVTFDFGDGNNDTVELEEGQHRVITMTLHGPPVLFLKYDHIIGLDKNNGKIVKDYGTHIMVELRFPNDHDSMCAGTIRQGVPAVGEKNCGPRINSENWKGSHTLILKAVTDGLYKAAVVSHKCFIFLKHIDQSGGAIAPEITLTTVDVDIKTANNWEQTAKTRQGSNCHAVNDPHLKTFDQFYYDVQIPGEFIMYRNTVLGYQVNAFFATCYSVACVCGVAVRAGDDVVVINKCKTATDQPGTLRAYVWKNGVLTPGLKVYYMESPETYLVYLPSGMYVRVSTVHWKPQFMSFVIEPSVGDVEKTEGLCGYYDGKKMDDFRDKNGNVFKGAKVNYFDRYIYTDIDEYGKEWLVSETNHSCNESIFKGVKADLSPIEAKQYCRCVLGSHTYDCGVHYDAEPCIPTAGVTEITDDPTMLEPFDPKHCNTNSDDPPNMPKIRKKRSDIYTPHVLEPLASRQGSDNPPKGRPKRSATYTPPVGEDDEYQSFVFDDPYVPKTLSWPTTSGWTESTAKTFCENFLLTKDSVKNCKAFMGKTFETEIDACVFDIKVSDGTEFAKSTLMNIISQCSSEAHKHPATTTELPGGVKRTTLYESLCLDNCNNNGVCKEARCVCNPGFYGSTCSLTKDIPPNIIYMSRNGLCNTRTRNCTMSYVFGTGHIDSTDLRCRMTPYNHRTGIRDLKGQFTSTAIYVNSNLLVCPHKNKNGTFLVAVSNNNGKDYSKDELLFLAYDSACHNCSSVDQDEKKANCTQETYGCAVGSACYLDGEVDEGNICWICDTNRNIDNWSVNTAYSNCTTDPEDNNIALIAGVTTAAVLVVAIIITVVLTLKFCGKKKKSVSPPSAADIQAEAGRSESTADEPKPENADNRKMSGVSASSITPAWTE